MLKLCLTDEGHTEKKDMSSFCQRSGNPKQTASVGMFTGLSFLCWDYSDSFLSYKSIYYFLEWRKKSILASREVPFSYIYKAKRIKIKQTFIWPNFKKSLVHVFNNTHPIKQE